MAIIDEYETIYSLLVKGCGITEKQHMMEDIPHEYRVVKNDSCVGGIIVWGRYKDRWYPNPSCRYLISVLMRTGNLYP